jgi:hypothetical protein
MFSKIFATPVRPSSWRTGSVTTELSGSVSSASILNDPEVSPLAETEIPIFPGFPVDLITLETGISIYHTPSVS